MSAKEAFKQAIQPGQLLQSFWVMVIVGTILNIINQGDALTGHAQINIAKLCLTYAVPFLVATYGAWSAFYSRTDQ